MEGGNAGGTGAGSSFYYDDGINFGGYQKIPADNSGRSGSSLGSSSGSSSSISGRSSSTAVIVDDSVLKG